MTLQVPCLLDMPEDEYHADDFGHDPSLSSSIAHTLVSKSPLHAWLEHPKLGGKRREPTKSMDKGTLVHRLLLGKGKDVAVIEADDFKTKAAREDRDAAREAGLIPMIRHEYDDALVAVDAIGVQLKQHGIRFVGESEIVALWTETASDGSEVRCRARLDHWTRQTLWIDDLKTCRSAHPRACRNHILEYGYAIQRAAYIRAIEKAHPELVGRVKFRLLFAEVEPPYALTPVTLSGQFAELGDRRWLRAVNTWARCTAEQCWPGYAPKTVIVEPPPWALSDEMDAEFGQGPAAE